MTLSDLVFQAYNSCFQETKTILIMSFTKKNTKIKGG